MLILRRLGRFGLLAFALPLLACNQEVVHDPAPVADDPVARALDVAQSFVDGYYRDYTDQAYDSGYTDLDYSRLVDHGAEALAAWHEREDAWLEELRAIDPAALAGTAAEVPYAYALDRIESHAGLRVCRTHLWNVSPAWTGWQSALASTFAQQPVGSDQARADALARARDAVRFIDTEVVNLRQGLKLGYTAPRENVEAVIGQLDRLLGATPEESPFFEPATRDAAEGFGESLLGIVKDEITPAIQRHRNFLAEEYLEAARQEPGVFANPDGEACYRSAIRYYTSLPLTPQEVHDSGLAELEKIHAEMRAIGERSFDLGRPSGATRTADIHALLETVRTDRRYTFSSPQEVIDYAQAAVDRARDAIPEWFGTMPRSEVIIRPYPDFMKRSGGGFYNPGTADGSRPGVYELGTWEPETIPKAGMEAVTFHETYPGHHLQVMTGLERAGVHPIQRYLYFSGLGEGWALYTERLAEEMGLYSSDLDRVGMLSAQAWRAARLVVDTGMHALGWSRQQGVDFLLSSTALSEAEANYEINRYLAVPAQALSYMTGSLEIQRLRAMAEERLGERFDVRAFHDRVIEDGTITLGMLRAKIERWVEEGG